MLLQCFQVGVVSKSAYCTYNEKMCCHNVDGPKTIFPWFCSDYLSGIHMLFPIIHIFSPFVNACPVSSIPVGNRQRVRMIFWFLAPGSRFFRHYAAATSTRVNGFFSIFCLELLLLVLAISFYSICFIMQVCSCGK